MPFRKIDVLAGISVASVLLVICFVAPVRALALPPIPQSATSVPSSPASTTSPTATKKAAPVHHVIYHRRRVRHVVRRRVASTRRTSTHTAAKQRIAVRHVAHRRVASRATHPTVRRAVRRVYRKPVRTAHYRRVTYTRARHVPYHHALYRRLVWSPWNVSSFSDPSLGDNPAGDVQSIREAALKALGRWNGSIVVVDPNTGRILSMVNQKLALTRGYIPCSTVKPMVALGGLDQGIINLNTKLMGMFGRRVDLTEALAHSDNKYFAEVGEMLGFDRVREFAEELGYGQKASFDIADESAGVFPSAPPPQAIGGVGKLTSFGTGIDQTPLQMAAIVSAIANGGTLYWLQYPRTPEEVTNFTPKIRRVLTNLMPYIPEVRQGMAAAVLYGTARSAYNPEEDLFGKTGTCSEDGGRMGWFVSYSEQEHPQYVVVVMLRGGRPMFGPHAAEIAGQLYRSLLPNVVENAQGRKTPRMPELIHRAGE